MHTEREGLVTIVDVLSVDSDERELALLSQLHRVVAVLYNINTT